MLHASESENVDLLWGLRGGGGNFGIVTQFEFDLHPLGPIVYAGPIFYPADAARDLLRAFRDWAPGVPDEVTALVNLTQRAAAAGDSGRVARREGRDVRRRVDRLGRRGRGTRGGIRSVAEPIADLLGPMPYQVIQTLLDPLWPKGIHAYFKATNLARLDDELVDRLCEIHLAAPGPQCEIHVHQMGGAVARVDDGATAFAERSMPFVLNAVTGWHDADAGSAHREWARATIAAASEHRRDARTSTSSVTRTKRERHTARTRTPVSCALKNDYDPTNVFRLNQNIAPAGS